MKFKRILSLVLAFSFLMLPSCTSDKVKVESEAEIKNPDSIIPIKGLSDEEYTKLLNDLSVEPKASKVDGYLLNKENNLIYNPLSKEAAKLNLLGKYDSDKKTTGKIIQNGITFTYSMPTKVAPYDLVPIEYTYKASEETAFPIHFEATTFEDESKRKGEDLYDMTLPNRLDMSFEYLGYVTGKLKPDARPIMNVDNTDTPAEAYPNFVTTELAKSGTVLAGDVQWFKFKYTNTGDTIIDPEGSGAMLFEPEMHVLNSSGNYELYAAPINQYYRIDDYMYPGDSAEVWFNFGPSAKKGDSKRGLSEGDYRIILKAVYRNEQSNPQNWDVNIWAGSPMAISNFDFSVSDTLQNTEPKNIVSVHRIEKSRKNTWLGKYEEFMTSFDTIKSSDLKEGKGTIYLQVAPWTTEAVIKVITERDIKTAAIPIEVDNDSVKIEFNPNNDNFSIVDGKKQPLFATQLMSDMRSNIQLSPYPEKTIVNDILSMKELGINHFATTGMPWIFDQEGNRVFAGYDVNFNPQGDAYKYAIDVIRATNSTIEGIMTYPINRGVYASLASAINKKSVTFGMGASAPGDRIPTTSKALALINSILANFYFQRFGDVYYQNSKGEIPFVTEDTRGWMRIDLDTRYQDGPASGAEFAMWLNAKYGSLEEINKAFGTTFAKLADISPEKYGTGKSGHGLEYTDKTQPFADWNLAMVNFDLFRTHTRLENYNDIIAGIDKNIPNPRIAIRTEGSNWLVSGIPSDSPNSHYRHIYYSQRRIALIAEVLQSSNVITSHSDYITLPYTPSEIRELTKMAVSQGITPSPLPQFNNMRDMAVNSMHGNPIQNNYNLDSEQKVAYVHTLTASFPWYKALYEEGGVPGILWSDYECDGVAGATQRKEISFFRDKLKEALSTTEGQKWCEDVKPLNQDWRNSSLKKSFYDNEFVKKIIELVKQK